MVNHSCFLPTRCTYGTSSCFESIRSFLNPVFGSFFIRSGQISLVSGVKRSIGTPGDFSFFYRQNASMVQLATFYLPSADFVGRNGDGIGRGAFHGNAWWFLYSYSLPVRCKSGFTFTLFLSNPIDLLAQKRFNKSRFTSWSVSKNNFLGSVSRYWKDNLSTTILNM